MQSGGRLILVSNRLPVSVSVTKGSVEVRPSGGGLATGMRGVGQQQEQLWIGWPGAAAANDEQRASMDAKLAELSTVPVHLSTAEVQHFYEDVSNGVLWPLFHYLIDRVPLVVRHWDAYVRCNQRFCDVVAAHARPGDRVWVHDYHLFLLPALLRARLHDVRIGFFLHIPFPASEVFRTLPRRDDVLRGLLGADLIGFHSYDYLRHFADSLAINLGHEVEVDRVDVDGHSVRLGVFPMGIDAHRFDELSRSESAFTDAQKLRASHGVEKLLLGVDRLDYTKGLPRKVLAMERLLERNPKLRGKVRLIQIAVPSREQVDAYRTLRNDVEQLVGRVNGAYGSLQGAPVHYLYRSVSESQLVSSYRAADVMLVTPLRDGMNLVAKEFVASRSDGDGVLVLSELAGAASELGEAVIVNPYDVEALALAFERAISMPESERRERMAALRQKVMSRPVQIWAESFLATLADHAGEAAHSELLRAGRVEALAEELAGAAEVAFALDYDGTLVQLRARPELARPDPELVELLGALSALPGVQVAVLSGRMRDSLEEWLGNLPIALAAEHGFWFRPRPGTEWQSAFDSASCSWKPTVRAAFEEYTVRTPGALIEEKAVGLAWHYRNAAPLLGTLRARELRMHLVQTLAQAPVAILTGRRVVEVRPQGVDKGRIFRERLIEIPEGVVPIAFGDDRTDEDLFAALPERAHTFHVGAGPTRARYRVNDSGEVRRFLNRFAQARRARH